MSSHIPTQFSLSLPYHLLGFYWSRICIWEINAIFALWSLFCKFRWVMETFFVIGKPSSKFGKTKWKKNNSLNYTYSMKKGNEKLHKKKCCTLHLIHNINRHSTIMAVHYGNCIRALNNCLLNVVQSCSRIWLCKILCTCIHWSIHSFNTLNTLQLDFHELDS